MDNESLVLGNLNHGNQTANEVIDSIYFDDQKNQIKREGWKYYNHLNKLFAPLEEAGFIKVIGQKRGPGGRFEKVWALTDMAREKLNKKSS